MVIRGGWAVVAAAAIASTVSSLACSDVCEEAVDTLRKTCDITTEGDPDVECAGAQQAYSQCIVDHAEDACDYYDDPVAHGDNAFAMCIAAIE